MFTDEQRLAIVERDLEIRRVDQELAELKHKQWKSLPDIPSMTLRDLKWLRDNLTGECVWIRITLAEELMRRGENE